MGKPVIGVTCHTLAGSLGRSAVLQIYIEAVQAAGGAAVAVPVGLDPDSLHAVFVRIDGLLLPGGDDVDPEHYGHDRHPMLGAVDQPRDFLELTITRWALDARIPILGICRGIQVLAVAAGGTLYQDIPSEWETQLAHDVREYGRDYLSHRLTVESGTVLADALGTMTLHVNSFHHQAVRDLPPDFRVSAWADDGIVEAIEHAEHPFIVGVQCHPEGMWQTTRPEFAGLFAAFVRAARTHSPAAER